MSSGSSVPLHGGVASLVRTPRPRAGPTTLTARAAEAESRLRLRWRERGGPPAAVPASRGFGTRFVEFAAARELGGERN